MAEAPWAKWWQSDLPCRFSQADTSNNLSLLTDVLGSSWISKAASPHSDHPLGREWATKGSGAFLQLNALAEDIRLVREARNFEALLDDLLDGKQCLAAWHVIRTAAMFVRGGASLREFFLQSDQKVPDYVIDANHVKINVEAKRLLRSDKEELFNDYASPLRDRIMNEILGAEAVHPVVSVVFKDVEQLPAEESVLAKVTELVDANPSSHCELRSERFNVFIAPPPQMSGLYRMCQILCVRSEKENIRVSGRAREASHQLLSDMAAKRPGIMFLGVSEHQDARAVYEILDRKFNAGQYPGISSLALSLSGTYMQQPRRTVVDYLFTIRNPRAKFTLPRRIPLKSLDLAARLIELQQTLTGVSAYRCAAAKTRISPETRGVFLPDIRRIEHDWL